jgi:hypothetical protein
MSGAVNIGSTIYHLALLPRQKESLFFCVSPQPEQKDNMAASEMLAACFVGDVQSLKVSLRKGFTHCNILIQGTTVFFIRIICISYI